MRKFAGFLLLFSVCTLSCLLYFSYQDMRGRHCIVNLQTISACDCVFNVKAKKDDIEIMSFYSGMKGRSDINDRDENDSAVDINKAQTKRSKKDDNYDVGRILSKAIDADNNGVAAFRYKINKKAEHDAKLKERARNQNASSTSGTAKSGKKNIMTGANQGAQSNAGGGSAPDVTRDVKSDAKSDAKSDVAQQSGAASIFHALD